MLVACVAAFGAAFGGQASAFTLKLTFPDGRPMTYGSACVGSGCLLREDRIGVTDAGGEVVLGEASGQKVEYRREGIDLAQTLPAIASGQLAAVGGRATVVLPRMLVGVAPALDAGESDLLARINDLRADRGLPLARPDVRLSQAMDAQAAWLVRSGATAAQTERFHIGEFGTTMAFRNGEVSMPQPEAGAEIAAYAASNGEAMSLWMASAAHRDLLLASGPILSGVGNVGSIFVVAMHPQCLNCEQAAPTIAFGPGGLSNATPAAPGGAPTTGSSRASGARPAPSCGREQLRALRLRNRRGRMRVQVRTSCLRPTWRYTLTVRQHARGRVLATRRVAGAGAMTLALRPARSARTLRIRLVRGGRAVAAFSLPIRR